MGAIKVFHYGCSFTGNMLYFQLENIFLNKGYDYKNLGKESSSNLDIFNKFKNTCLENSICIIQWSSLTRPFDENYLTIFKKSINPLFDLLEQWYLILNEVQKIIKEKNIKLIQYIGWAQWKDSELNLYHRNMLNSFGINWFSSKKTLDLIQSNCFQLQSPSEWTSHETENNMYLWDDILWGGLSEWVRDNIVIDKRYIGKYEYDINGNLIFDPHPSEFSFRKFIYKFLIKNIQFYENYK